MKQSLWVVGFLFPTLAAGWVSAETARYRLVPDLSWIEYEADSIMGSVVGRNDKLTGEMAADPTDVFKTATLAVTAPTNAFDSGWEGRDEEVVEIIQADKFPNLSLTKPTVLRWTPFPNPNQPTGADGEVAIWVTFRGVQVQEDVLFRMDRSDDGRILIRGQAETSMTKYRIEPPSVFFYTSDPEMNIRFELFFDPVSEEEALPEEETK